MDVRLGDPVYNFTHAAALVKRAAEKGADVVMLPETWNIGFFPKKNLAELADPDGESVRAAFSALAKERSVNIVAGSAATNRNGKVFNTAFVFNREGECVASYDKTHLFTPMGEHEYFTPGDRLCTFILDGVKCGLIICYDLRFPELTRSLVLQGADLLFVPAEWPAVRVAHWQTLNRARAIENQIFLACCNGCGTAGETVYGGSSAVYDPWGELLAQAGAKEEIILADCDFSVKEKIRESINVFRDRRPELYKL
jgi:predicted amidohydrolase